jgi:excisionase family DNA binding protein
VQHVQHVPLDNALINDYSCNMKQYLNASEIAKLLKVDRATVSRWVQKGKFKGAVRIGKSHQWRIPLSSFENLVKNKQ